MREIRQPPSAAAIVNSLRAIGYSFNTAIADIIDNSLAAAATIVSISFRLETSYVAIIDNGIGMSEQVLLSAMRHGGIGPTQLRETHDLGRYGLGLKTASLSQCRRLTVVSMVEGGRLHAARWDLSVIESQNDWILLLPSFDEISMLPGVSDIVAYGHGTLVLWEDFDRAIAGETHPDEALKKLILESGDHLSLVFHRFLSGERGHSITISLNGRKLQGADPFMHRNSYTEFAGEEICVMNGSEVSIKAYILPHISKMTLSEIELAGGRARLRDLQGFYLYRNKRLITYGTWFRLISRSELSRLARIQIDIPNALDHLWGLDVKKSTANPPEAVRNVLRQIIQTVSDKSANVFRERRRTALSEQLITYIWRRSEVRNGLRYDINRDHPLLEAFKSELSLEQLVQFDRIVMALEIALPVRQIYADQAQNESIDQNIDNVKESLRALLADLLSGLDKDRQSALRADLINIDPFKSYPAEVRAILEAGS